MLKRLFCCVLFLSLFLILFSLVPGLVCADSHCNRPEISLQAPQFLVEPGSSFTIYLSIWDADGNASGMANIELGFLKSGYFSFNVIDIDNGYYSRGEETSGYEWFNLIVPIGEFGGGSADISVSVSEPLHALYMYGGDVEIDGIYIIVRMDTWIENPSYIAGGHICEIYDSSNIAVVSSNWDGWGHETTASPGFGLLAGLLAAVVVCVVLRRM